MLVVQSNLASTYRALGRSEEALRLKRDVYSGRLKLNGEQHEETLRAANNYAWGLRELQRFKEAKSLLRATIPVARRVLGPSNGVTLKMRKIFAEALYLNDGATLDNLREAVSTLEDTERTARRVLGGANPTTKRIEGALQKAREALRARETPPPQS
jgi:hypothetical protein